MEALLAVLSIPLAGGAVLGVIGHRDRASEGIELERDHRLGELASPGRIGQERP